MPFIGCGRNGTRGVVPWNARASCSDAKETVDDKNHVRVFFIDDHLSSRDDIWLDPCLDGEVAGEIKGGMIRSSEVIIRTI